VATQATIDAYEQQQIIDALNGFKTFIPGMVAYSRYYSDGYGERAATFAILSRTKHFVTFHAIYGGTYSDGSPRVGEPFRLKVSRRGSCETCYRPGNLLSAVDVGTP
jgi:hypothetical protein